MTGRTNAGGGGLKVKDYAIGVKYPAGSECICVGGGKTYVSGGKQAGVWVFPVNESGEYTVTISKIEDGKIVEVSRTVELTEEAKVVQIELGYRLYIIKDGVIDTDKYPLTFSDSAYTMEQQVPYEGYRTLTVKTDAHGNHATEVYINNIEVPAWASTLRMEVASIKCYGNTGGTAANRTIKFGGDTGSSYVMDAVSGGRFTDLDVAMDVTAMRGITPTTGIQWHLFSTVAIADQLSYMGDIWFE